MQYIHKHFLAFTLVELIVVITIVGILSTVGFVSYSNYLTGARDSNRISQLVKLTDSLQVYGATKSLPLPDNKVDITASGVIVGYQGYAGTNVLETIDYSNGGQDPKDDSSFTYYISKERKKIQVLAFMEEASSIAFLGNVSYAADYTNRYPKVYGQKLGVFTQKNTNLPLQEIPGVINTFELFTNTGILLTSSFSDTDTITASGYTSWGLMATKIGEKAPTDCPDGFIGVPGNPEFSTQGFCVAQYEMTYSDANTPNSTIGGVDWNTVSYIPNKQIVSMVGKYPIVDITQAEAIAACQSMGSRYHLITNNEWMTIARNIEATNNNWSTSTIGQGNIWNGVSGDTILGCNSKGGNIESRLYATKTGQGIDTVCNLRRSHTLSNGQVIWDLSGNIYEHVNKANTIDGSGFNVGQISVLGTSNPSGYDDDGIYSQVEMMKFGSLLFQGFGKGFGNLPQPSIINNIIIRGGAAHNISNAGIYLIDVRLGNFFKWGHLGFRCAR